MFNNFILETTPLIVFFAVYYFTHNIFWATGVCIAVSWICLTIAKLAYKKVTKNMWLSTVLITILGGLTVMLHNKTFVMLKPTILYWILSFVLITSQLMGKNLIKLSLNKEFDLSNNLWNKLNISWAIYFIGLGILNLFVALNFSEYVWVKFKVFGCTSLTFLFLILTGVVVYMHQRKRPS